MRSEGLHAVLNVIWLLLGGVWLGLGYLIAGVIGCLLIVTIPAGIASFRMARYVVWPFGSVVVDKPNKGLGSTIMNAVWFVSVGWELALLHVLTALAQSLTVVGLANAIVSLKMIPVSLFPFGKQIVSRGSVAGNGGFDVGRR